MGLSHEALDEAMTKEDWVRLSEEQCDEPPTIRNDEQTALEVRAHAQAIVDLIRLHRTEYERFLMKRCESLGVAAQSEWFELAMGTFT